MYKEILGSINNVAIWPVMSFVIFFTFFIVLVWYVFTVDKNFMKEMSQKPLSDGSEHLHDVEPLNL